MGASRRPSKDEIVSVEADVAGGTAGSVDLCLAAVVPALQPARSGHGRSARSRHEGVAEQSPEAGARPQGRHAPPARDRQDASSPRAFRRRTSSTGRWRSCATGSTSSGSPSRSSSARGTTGSWSSFPGLLDKERAVKLIGETAQLEFKLVKQASESRAVIDRLNRALAGRSTSVPDSLVADSLTAANPLNDLIYDTDMSRYRRRGDPRGGLPEGRSSSSAGSISIRVLPRDASIGFSSQDRGLRSGARGPGPLRAEPQAGDDGRGGLECGHEVRPRSARSRTRPASR